MVRERQRSLAQAVDAAADIDVVSTLEAEGARLGAELSSSADEETLLGPERAALEESERLLESHERELAGRVARRRAESRPEEELDLARNRLELLRHAAGRAGEALSAFDDRITGLTRRSSTASETARALDLRASSMAEESEVLS